MTAHHIEILPTADKLAERVAEVFVTSARTALAHADRFSVALAGGSTPERAYRLLARPEWSAQVDWARCLIFLGDERHVPEDDPRSNLGMARRTLLDQVPIPTENIYPAVIGLETAREEAQAYATRIEPLLRGFDLLLLGLGDDGHTLSLFPGLPALNSPDLVTWSPPGVLPPPVERITLTFRGARAARHAVFVVSGPGKAEVLARVLAEGADPRVYPAAGILPAEGAVTWLVDADAARLLPA